MRARLPGRRGRPVEHGSAAVRAALRLPALRRRQHQPAVQEDPGGQVRAARVALGRQCRSARRSAADGAQEAHHHAAARLPPLGESLTLARVSLTLRKGSFDFAEGISDIAKTYLSLNSMYDHIEACMKLERYL